VLACPCAGTTTTTLPEGSTSTSTTTTTSLTSTTVTSTTTTSSTTTTTLGGSVAAGRSIYDSRCSVCHVAGSHDTEGFAPNLEGKGNLVVNNLSTIDPMMSGITLSNQEVRDVKAFLNSL
jgi:mono/diheme cytochrome c family protein